jgi:hypothetical protein
MFLSVNGVYFSDMDKKVTTKEGRPGRRNAAGQSERITTE